MTIAIPICALACAVMGSTHAGVDSLTFNRTYKDGEKLSYHAVMKMSGSDVTLDSIVSVSVAKKTADSKPRITMATTKYESTGTNVTPSPKPRDIVAGLVANNLPDALGLQQGDSSIYPMLFFAGMTADKSVNVGQEFPVVWSSKGDTPLAIKGKGKLTALDTVAKTASVTWTFSLSMGGQDVGQNVLKSVYDTSNCSLKSCEGTMTNGMFSISIKRQ